jgi:hypothetical protein
VADTLKVTGQAASKADSYFPGPLQGTDYLVQGHRFDSAEGSFGET